MGGAVRKIGRDARTAREQPSATIGESQAGANADIPRGITSPLLLSIWPFWVRSFVGLEGIHDVNKAPNHQDAEQRVPQMLQHPFVPQREHKQQCRCPSARASLPADSGGLRPRARTSPIEGSAETPATPKGS